VKTVEFHRERIMQKLGVKTAAELFRRCLGAA
jgi:DNA-binding CsgD family transcriptional regulator